MYQKGQIILDFEQECKRIYFIVNGVVDLEVMGSDGQYHILDTLQQGDFIGQYSVLFYTTLVFRIVAMTTTVRVLTLSDTFFCEYGDKDHIAGLRDAILEAQEHEERYGLPTCDYVKY